MKTVWLQVIAIGFVLLFVGSQGDVLAQGCLESSTDQGYCDTLNVICLDCVKQEGESGPWTVRFPLLVSHDQTEDSDSLAGFTVPLAFTHSNPAAYCSVGVDWNNTSMGWWYTNFGTSIYRHMVNGDDTLYHNRMALLEADFSMRGWDMTVLTLDDTSNFWLAIVPTGTEDQRWWEGNRVLLATMTLRIEDTMHVCIDSTLWPPNSNLGFTSAGNSTYTPRHNLPQSFWVGFQRIQVQSPNGGEIWAVGTSENITWTSENFEGPSVKIEYSTNSGGNWSTIINSAANTGSYSWTIPNKSSNHCRVRVTETQSGILFDVSDEDFSIVKPDFTIEVQPDTQIVIAENSANFYVELISIYRFNSPCSLTITGLPTNTSYYFVPNPITPTDNSILTISADSLVTTGIYNLTIKATQLEEPQLQHNFDVTLIIKHPEFSLQPEYFSVGEHCPNCIVNWCRTTYPTYDDFDGDGMNDEYEMQLALQFKPTLYLDNETSELPWLMPAYYDVPYYSYEENDLFPGHGEPADVISNGSVYVHVRPYGVVAPGVAFYIEVAYWYYFSYNQAECQNGYFAEHGHDWEHMAICLSVPPDGGPLQVVSVFFAHHEKWDYKAPEQVTWTGEPGLSSVKVYIADGSHASYPSPGTKCTAYVGECVCYENPNGMQQVTIEDSKIINMYELDDPRAPKWLDYAERWPGTKSCIHLPILYDECYYPPYGPAWGSHAYWWYEGHFEEPFSCIETWRENIETPANFQVSNIRNGTQLYNALYLTWDGPQDEDGFSLRRCLEPINPYLDNPTCECIAQLDGNTFSYLDSCLDGMRPYYYELKTFHDNPDPAYRGCSEPAIPPSAGYALGEPCTGDMRPEHPVIKPCDSCILRWEDKSWNEEGFLIALSEEICGEVGPNVEEYAVCNCCTGNKRFYTVGAYNEYGISWSQAMPCNELNCVIKPGCEDKSIFDVNDDWLLNLTDVIYLLNYLFKGEPAPIPLEAGDANCNGLVNLGDAVYLLGYLFKGQAIPGCYGIIEPE